MRYEDTENGPGTMRLLVVVLIQKGFTLTQWDKVNPFWHMAQQSLYKNVTMMFCAAYWDYRGLMHCSPRPQNS